MGPVRDDEEKTRVVRHLKGLLEKRQDYKKRVSAGERFYVTELIDIDPQTYHFGTVNGNDLCREHGPKVMEILDGSNNTETVRKRLNSREGYFDEIESREIFRKAVDYVVDYICTEYVDDEYPKNGDLYVWALGIILCYLLCGYPALRNEEDKQCYDNIGIGPASNSEHRRMLDASGREYPPKNWNSITPLSRTVVKQCTHCGGPGYRPSFFELTSGVGSGSYIPWDVMGWNAMSDDQLWRVMKGKECLYKNNFCVNSSRYWKGEFDRYELQKEARNRRENQRSSNSEHHGLVWEAFMAKASRLAKRKRVKLYGLFATDEKRENLTEGYDEDRIITEAVVSLTYGGNKPSLHGQEPRPCECCESCELIMSSERPQNNVT